MKTINKLLFFICSIIYVVISSFLLLYTGFGWAIFLLIPYCAIIILIFLIFGIVILRGGDIIVNKTLVVFGVSMVLIMGFLIVFAQDSGDISPGCLFLQRALDQCDMYNDFPWGEIQRISKILFFVYPFASIAFLMQARRSQFYIEN